jgi:hypothetical protein
VGSVQKIAVIKFWSIMNKVATGGIANIELHHFVVLLAAREKVAR